MSSEEKKEVTPFETASREVSHTEQPEVSFSCSFSLRQILLLVLFVINLGLNAALIFLVKDAEKELAWQLNVSIILLIISFFALCFILYSFCIQNLHIDGTRVPETEPLIQHSFKFIFKHTFLVEVFLIVSLPLQISLVAYPDLARLLIVTINLLITGILINRDVLSFQFHPAAEWRQSDDLESYTIPEKSYHSIPNDDKCTDIDNNLHEVDRYIRLKKVRKIIYNKMVERRNGFTWWCLVILLVSLISWVVFYVNTVGASSSFWSVEELAAQNKHETTSSYFPVNSVDRRVVLFVIDGLRWDHLEKNTDFKAMLEDSEFQSNSRIYHMRAQLPSMSVPNWLTILIGAKPEITGVLGNLNVPETKFDSIFSELKKRNPDMMYDDVRFMRGLTGHPWFGEIIKSQLMGLEGLSQVDMWYGSDSMDLSSEDFADDRRAAVAYYAVNRTEAPYQFFLVHLGDVDTQGHCCGVSNEYNKENTYYKAVTNKTRIMQNMINLVKAHPLADSTVVLITSDHGQVDAGGHGGVDSVLRDIPFVIYSPNSGLNNLERDYTGPKFKHNAQVSNPWNTQSQPMDNTMISASVCALLNVPVPRQSYGVFLNDIMALINSTDDASNTKLKLNVKDLFIQKQSMVNAFIEKIGHAKDDDDEIHLLASEYNPTDNIQKYITGVERLLELYEVHRTLEFSLTVLRNLFLGGIVCVVLVIHLAYRIQRFSFIAPSLIFSVPPNPDFIPNSEGFYDDSVKNNRFAFYICLLWVIIYLGICIGIYILLNASFGYTTWDSTIIHTPQVLFRYLLMSLIPGAVLQFFFLRAIHFPHIIFISYVEAVRMYKNAYIARLYWIYSGLSRLLLFYKTSVRGLIKYKEFDYLYCVRTYLSNITASVLLIIIIFQSSYGFVIPGIFNVGFLNETIWALRFRVLTLQLMCLPLLVETVLIMFYWPELRSDSPIYDDIFLLKIRKDVSCILSQNLSEFLLGLQKYGIDDPNVLQSRSAELASEYSLLVSGKKYADLLECFTSDEKQIEK